MKRLIAVMLVITRSIQNSRTSWAILLLGGKCVISKFVRTINCICLRCECIIRKVKWEEDYYCKKDAVVSICSRVFQLDSLSYYPIQSCNKPRIDKWYNFVTVEKMYEWIFIIHISKFKVWNYFVDIGMAYYIDISV